MLDIFSFWLGGKQMGVMVIMFTNEPSSKEGSNVEMKFVECEGNGLV